jgi:hypothetical protein
MCIVALYDELLAIHPSPIVALNRAVAVGMSDGPLVGLRAIDAVETELPGLHLVPAARAELMLAQGDPATRGSTSDARSSSPRPTKSDDSWLAGAPSSGERRTERFQRPRRRSTGRHIRVTPFHWRRQSGRCRTERGINT